jgi:hypothetical protein
MKTNDSQPNSKSLNGAQQGVPLDWFGEEIHRARLQGPHGAGNVAAAPCGCSYFLCETSEEWYKTGVRKIRANHFETLLSQRLGPGSPLDPDPERSTQNHPT